MSGYLTETNRSQTMLFPERLDDLVHPDNPVSAVDASIDALVLRDLGFGLMTMALVMYEARFGYALGVSLDICRAVGGQKATNPNKCITRTCFWFGDCGTWPSPGVYRENLAIGDPVSKAIFWLGDWSCQHGRETAAGVGHHRCYA